MITKRARWRRGLAVMPSHGARTMRHQLSLPPRACPVSSEPASATLVIRYQPRGAVLEVKHLEVWATTKWRTSSGLEAAGEAIHRGLRAVLGRSVRVTLLATLHSGQQVEMSW